MNERIKQLAEQAGVLADFGEDIKVGRWGIGGSYQSMEKFAELIVKECANFVDSHEQIDKYGEAQDIVYGKDLLEHFGVEE